MIPRTEELQLRIEELEADNERLRAEKDELELTCADFDKDLESAAQEIAELEMELDRSIAEGISNGSDEEPVYIASRVRPHFHRQDCDWAHAISESNRLEFGSHREAVEAGYKPCKTCRA